MIEGDQQSGRDAHQLVRKIGEEGTPLHPLISLAAIVALVAANYGVFRLFDRNYFRWYLDHGAVLALGLSLVALAVDLDRDPTLVDSHPGRYSAGWLAVVGETFMYLAGDVLMNRAVRALDLLFIMVFDVAFLAAAVCWLAVIAPLQYFITLVTGAPARGALTSRRMWVERRGKTISLRKDAVEGMPQGAEEIGFAARPVTVTASITAGALFAVSLLT